MKLRQFYVYILSSVKNGTLYIGVTSNLINRTNQHQSKAADSFTKKYKVDRLVYFEIHDTIESSIAREKSMKAWKRDWKIKLIEKENAAWRDLSLDL